MARVSLKKVQKSGSEEAIKDAQAKLDAAKEGYMAAQTELHAAFQAKKIADLKIEGQEEDKEEVVQATAVENNLTVEAAGSKAATAVEPVTKATEYIKTNNGNGNGNKAAKEEKEKQDKEKEAKGKSEEAKGNAGKGNGKKN
jgi:hypothetical protein